MSEDDRLEGLSIAGRTLPAAFVRREIVVSPGATRPYDPTEWVDSLVVVKAGEIELEGHPGHAATFRRGDILWLTGLPLRRLHNRGAEPAVLVALSRRQLAGTGH